MSLHWHRLVLLGGIFIWTLTALPAKAQTTILPTTFHAQEHPLSCEVAALKMALGTHDIEVSENDLISKLPFDLTPRGNGIWGNPYTGFVGNIDGLMLRTGYGVYWDPIAKLGAQYTNTRVVQGSSPEELTRSIAAGNPVIIWGYYGSGKVYTWHTPDGTLVKALSSEHTQVVYGFDGSPTKPIRFYIMDPVFGPHVWSTEQLKHNWSSFDSTGVIVAPRWIQVPGDAKIWEISRDGTTRHWVTSWEVFIRRGGSTNAITPIDKNNILKYKIGSEIRS
jgi:uncharacterized protein YvpB